MRHRKDLVKLGRPKSHRKALVHSLVRSLFLHDRITTTLTKAKVAQRMAERLVYRSQRNDLASRRYAYTYLNDHELVKYLFEELRPRFEGRNSGFTRIFLLGTRPGDGAQMAVLEMIVKGESKKDKKSKQTEKSSAAKTKSSSKSSDKKDAEKPKKTKASAESKSKKVKEEASKKKKAPKSGTSKKTSKSK